MKLFSNLVLFSHAIEARKPNVLLIITDDLGVGDFQIYNREAKVPTPNVDRLGHEGVNFYGATTASSRCSPSRYMLMTGRYSMEDQEGRIINQARLQNPDLAHFFYFPKEFNPTSRTYIRINRDSDSVGISRISPTK